MGNSLMSTWIVIRAEGSRAVVPADSMSVLPSGAVEFYVDGSEGSVFALAPGSWTCVSRQDVMTEVSRATKIYNAGSATPSGK